MVLSRATFGVRGSIIPGTLSYLIFVGWGFVTNTFAGGLSWQGYFLGFIGGRDGEWAYANLGVFFALVIGSAGYFLSARKTLALQNSAS